MFATKLSVVAASVARRPTSGACLRAFATLPNGGKHFITAEGLTRADVEKYFDIARKMKANVASQRQSGAEATLLRGKVLCTMFFEPSTRTRLSFTTGGLRLGAHVIDFNEHASSAKKGETLPDTIRTVQNFADVIVIRHPQQGSAAIAAGVAKVPIINAGDGAGEHPTQAMLDLFQIVERFGKLDGLTITLLGDLKYGRTVHSLVKLLKLFNAKVNLVSPEQLQMPQDLVQKYLPNASPAFQLTPKILSETNVLYQTRVQKERFEDLDEYNRLKDAFVISPATLAQCKPKDMMLMHPLPRVDEITTDVDKDPRAVYFSTPEFGLYMRMALVASSLGKA